MEWIYAVLFVGLTRNSWGMSRQRTHNHRNGCEHLGANDPLDDLYDYERTPTADLYDYAAPLPRRPKRGRKRPPNDDLSD
jgi:hypothetical protein